MNDLAIVIRQYLFFHRLVNLLIRIVTMERCDFLTAQIFFTEAIEWCVWTCPSTIESPLYGYDTAQRIIFHIIAEYHQLRNVDEAAKLFIREAFFIHSCALRQHTTMIVGFLHFYKTKWQSVYEQSNVRTKFVLSVLTGKFGCEMKRIIPCYQSLSALQAKQLWDGYKSLDRGHHRSVPYEYLSKLEETLPHVRDSDS